MFMRRLALASCGHNNRTDVAPEVAAPGHCNARNIREVSGRRNTDRQARFLRSWHPRLKFLRCSY